MARPSRENKALIRMGELSRLTGVPASTIKYYMREGLLPGAAVSVTRNSALYDPSLVQRVQAIKEMQQVQFLPLWRIKEILAGQADPKLSAVAAAVDRALKRPAGPRPIRRAAAISRGLSARTLDELTRAGILPPDDPLTGDAAGLVETIFAAQRAGLTAHVDIAKVLKQYDAAVRRLVQTELVVFIDQILPAAGDELGALTQDAMHVAERILVHMRRRMLFPELERIVSGRGKKRARRAPRKPRG